MANGRRANEETQLDVDRMILDYLTFMAEKALFDEYEAHMSSPMHHDGAVQSTQIPLQMINCRCLICIPTILLYLPLFSG